MNQIEERNIVFFDGVCNFCNKSVDFLIRHNVAEDLSYCSLQNDFAKTTLKRKGINNLDLNTVYFLKNDELYEKSSAVLKLIPHLNWYFVFLYPGYILPKKWRDWMYSQVAKRRYKLLGKRDSCRIPTEKESRLFIN